MNLEEARAAVEFLRRRRRKCPWCAANGVLRYMTPTLVHRVKREGDAGWREEILGPQIRLTCTRGCRFGELLPVSEESDRV